MNNPKNCSEAFTKALRQGLILPGKKTAYLLSLLFLILLISSCATSASEKSYQEESAKMSDAITQAAGGLVTDTINGITHHFAKAADLKFKVKSVLETSNQIEDLVSGKGGYVASSNLTSSVTRNLSIRHREDSLLESCYYTTLNTMSIRVPARQLDSLLRAISGMALFIDFRKMTSEDMKVQLYSNLLAEKRNQSYKAELKKDVEKSADKLESKIKARDMLLDKQTTTDNAELDSYLLEDKVNYSTVTLELYQAEQVRTEARFAPPAIEPFEPSFSAELKAAFLKGLDLLTGAFLFVIRSWGLIFFFLLLLLSFKRIRSFVLQRVDPSSK